ncbi:MAG: hypothetical protein WC081_00985 [Candidatus Ratteibacteria bacterium]
MIKINQKTEKGISPEKDYIIRQQKVRMVMCCCMRKFSLVTRRSQFM